MDLIKVAEQAFAAENPVEHPSFNTGDTVSVHYKIVEGNKERIQVFRGVAVSYTHLIWVTVVTGVVNQR